MIKGISASGGIAFGIILYKRKTEKQMRRITVSDVQGELQRFAVAKKEAVRQLQTLYQRALNEVGSQEAALFDIHQMMLEDEDYCTSISSIIQVQKVNAEYAVAVTADNFSGIFSGMDDPYMRERAADVRDVSERLIACLSGRTSFAIESDSPVVIAADDLSPSETIRLDKNKILAFVASAGSTNSHTAILARTMGIPAIVAMGDAISDDIDGKTAIVDGYSGDLYIEPDPDTQNRLQQKNEEKKQHKLLLDAYKGKANRTVDGREILIYANIGDPSELSGVLENDAGGIGLFRTEFLYLASKGLPSEEEQFTAYQKVTQALSGKRVIFRTLDVGADKHIDYLGLKKEENPALGLRGLRVCLEHPEILKAQLRALLRASAFGNAAIMFPMITSLWEIQEAKRLVEEAKTELDGTGIRYNQTLEIGVMIETPAAALISDKLAQEVDFFSVGTNDLSQYTLAIDRQNSKLARFFDPHHEAVLHLIQYAAEAAHKHGIWIGICGELAADLTMTKHFLKMGIDELSVPPNCVLPLRQCVREMDFSTAI